MSEGDGPNRPLPLICLENPEVVEEGRQRPKTKSGESWGLPLNPPTTAGPKGNGPRFIRLPREGGFRGRCSLPRSTLVQGTSPMVPEESDVRRAAVDRPNPA